MQCIIYNICIPLIISVFNIIIGLDRDVFAVYDSSDSSLTAFMVRPDDVQEDGGTTSVVSLGKTKIPSR